MLGKGEGGVVGRLKQERVQELVHADPLARLEPEP